MTGFCPGPFECEARAVAALNHPHICQLYDVGPNYLVMEFVDGNRLQGPLSVEKAVEYAGQILDALEVVHRKGITHRDLKPANIRRLQARFIGTNLSASIRRDQTDRG